MDDPGAIVASGTLSSMRELQRTLLDGGLSARIVAGEGAPKSA